MTVNQPNFATLFYGIWCGLVHPRLFGSLVLWTVKQNYAHPLHWIRSTILIPEERLKSFIILAKINPMSFIFSGAITPRLLDISLVNHMPRLVLSHFLGAYDLSRKFKGTQYVATRADVVWTHSKSNLSAIYSLGVDQNKVFVSYRGIDFKKIKKVKNSGVERIPRRIATAGCLEASKKFTDVIEVFKMVNRKYSDSSLVIMGDGPERNRLKAMASSNDLAEKIHFTGHISHKKVFSEMAKAEIFLLLSTKESERLPNVVKEAMACGCIVIASDTQGINELITEKEDGFVFNKKDKKSIVNTIFEIFSNKVDKHKMREKALFKLNEKFDLNKNMTRYIAVWEKLKEQKC